MFELPMLLLFMIVTAVIALEVKDLLSSVIAVGGCGIALSMIFLALRAPDLAIVQLVVELLSLILLIRATSHRDLPFSASGRWLFNTISSLLFIVLFFGSAYLALKFLPPFGKPLLTVSQSGLAEALARGGASNLVAALSLNIRSYDILGEVVILFTAIVGVLALARRVARQRQAKDE